MSIFDMHQAVVDDYRQYVQSFISIADPAIRCFVEKELADGCRLWPEPLVQLNPEYQRAGTVDDLVSSGQLMPATASILRTDSGEPYRLFQDQHDAVGKASQKQSYVVTSGTGSGKRIGREKTLRKSFSLVLTLASLVLVFTPKGNAQTPGPRSLITQAINENQLVRLAGNTRPEATSSNDLGPVADDLHLDMYLQLKRSPEQELAAAQFVESLADPKSPNFHKWITAAEYGQRFGAAPEDIATVSRWLESQGFTVNNVPSNNMVIDFSGNAGQVRKALHTEIHTLSVAGEQRFANMSDPQIPAAFLPAVTGVVSLHNFKPHPMLVPKAQYTISASNLPVVPGDLATICNLNPAFSAGYTGLGQTIVVVEDTDLYNGTSDWSTFRNTFGLAPFYPFGSLTQIHPAPGTGGPACSDPGVNADDKEAAIEVEWASAAAPNAAIVMASCAGTTIFGGFLALQNMLTNGGPLPGIVSISYGFSETQNGAAYNSYINTLYQLAAAEGVSVFVAAGDSAAAMSDHGGTKAVHGINVSGFASTIYDVAVGGTDFGDYAAGTTSTFWNFADGVYYDSARSYVPEIRWNDSCGSVVRAKNLGFSTTYGPSGFCNSLTSSEQEYFLNVTGGSGGPSRCATGTPTVANVVSGTCAGYACFGMMSLSPHRINGNLAGIQAPPNCLNPVHNNSTV